MQKLNLPAYGFRLKNAGGKVWIFDVIRKKFVVLTPEEWVRQHLVQYLVNQYKYPKTLIKIETGLKFNTLGKRTDVVVYDRTGNNWMVIECKSPDHPITAATAFQAAVYNSSLRARYVLLSNGLQHFCFETDFSVGKVTAMDTIPIFK
jgi:hypothetical protein